MILSPAKKNLLFIAFIFYIIKKHNGVVLKVVLIPNWFNSLLTDFEKFQFFLLLRTALEALLFHD